MSQADDAARDLAVRTTTDYLSWAGWIREAEAAGYRLIRPEPTLDHACPTCGHACAQLERDLASFMRSGEWHPDAVRGTSIDTQLDPGFVRSIEQTGAIVGVKGNEPEPHALASQLRELARLVDHEGSLRDRERARRLGLAAARIMGPRWQHRARMIEGDDGE